MDNIDLILDSKDKNILSKGARIFHYVFGLFQIIASLFVIYRFIKANTFDISFYSMLIICLAGILWIIQGLAGRDFNFVRKYISLTNDSIKLKKAFKNEILLSQDSIVNISLKPSKLKIKTKDIVVDFDLTWITYNELQLLRASFAEFGKLNKIEVK